MKRRSNLRRIFHNALSLYFAPLNSAYKAVRDEMDRINRERNELLTEKHTKHV